MCTAAVVMLAACDLPSRELGSERERWTILEQGEHGDISFSAVAATPDDGIVAAGKFTSALPGLLRRYDADGEQLWSTSFVHEDSETFWPYDVAIAVDGTIVVSAEGDFDWIPKEPGDGPEYFAVLFGFDPDGAPLWERRIEGARSVRSVTALPDGTIAYAGTSVGEDAAIVGVVSTAGELGPAGGMRLDGSPAYVFDMAAQSDGRLVIALRHAGRIHCIGFDAALAPAWQHSSDEGFLDGNVAIAPDDTIWWLRRLDGRILGGDQSRIENDNRLTVLAADGTLVREVEGIDPDLSPRSIALGPDGTLLVAGQETRDVSDYQIAAAEIDPESGETLWFDTAGGHPNELSYYSEDAASDLTVTASGDFVVVGWYDDHGATGGHGWLRRYAGQLAEPM